MPHIRLHMLCPVCKSMVSLDLDEDAYRRWLSGTPVHEAFPNMTREEQLLLMHGVEQTSPEDVG